MLSALRRRFRTYLLLALLLLLLLWTFSWKWRRAPRLSSVKEAAEGCVVLEEPPDGSDFLIGELQTQKGSLKIAVFSRDDVISQAILNRGTWEPEILEALEKMFLLDPSLHFIDIGANLGVYSLLAARYGRRVIAVDANIALAERLRHSAQLNGLQERVKVVWNAVSRTREQHRLISPDGSNVGHSWLGPADAVQGGQLVRSVRLDDLLPLVDFHRAVLKMDIEGHEAQALEGAAALFETVDIPAVFMEWQWVANEQSSDSGLSIMEFMASRGYVAFPQALSDVPLNISAFRGWPTDIVWKKM